MIRDAFEAVGSRRLTDSFSKEKEKLKKDETYVPSWISVDDWNELKQHWGSSKFQQMSTTNSKNRLTNPSLHSGGSRPTHEYALKMVISNY